MFLQPKEYPLPLLVMQVSWKLCFSVFAQMRMSFLPRTCRRTLSPAEFSHMASFLGLCRQADLLLHLPPRIGPERSTGGRRASGAPGVHGSVPKSLQHCQPRDRSLRTLPGARCVLWVITAKFKPQWGQGGDILGNQQSLCGPEACGSRHQIHRARPPPLITETLLSPSSPFSSHLPVLSPFYLMVSI